MGRNGWIAMLVLLAALGGVGTLFVLQNGARTTQLSLDVGFAAWKLEQPISVPALVGICFGAGFLGGALVFGVRGMRLASKMRRLEQELAVSSAVTGSSGSTKPGSW